MRRILALLEKLLGPSSGYPVLSGLITGLLIAAIVVIGFWGITWLIHWLPWPKAAI